MSNKLTNYSFNPTWGKIVASFENGIFESFELCSGEELFYFQYIKRDIADELPFLERNRYFDIITPFDYGGFYYESDEILQKGLLEFEKKCIAENIISGFFRLNPFINNTTGIVSDFMNIVQVQKHIFVDLKKDFTLEYSNRKKRTIKKANRNNFSFIINDSIDNFYTVYIESMKRVEATHYFYFDLNVLHQLLDFGTIFSIKYDNTVVSSIFVIEDINIAYYFLGGTLQEYLKLGCNSLLFDLVFKYYKNKKDIFFLGGGSPNLHQYKREFSNHQIPFYIGKKIFNKELYDKLTQRNAKKNNDFFPKYRDKTV